MKSKSNKPGSSQASLKKIATMTGVSMMTVSRALSGKGVVAADTLENIKKIAQELRYRPNQLIRGIQTGRSQMIGVIFPTVLDFYQGVLSGIYDHLSENNYSPLINLVHGHQGKAAMEQERAILHRMIDLRVDGIILRPVNDEASQVYFEEIVDRKIPIVVIDRKLPQFPCDFVGTDDFMGGKEAAQILIGEERKNLLLVWAGKEVSTSRERAGGFRSVIQKSKKAHLQEINCGDFFASSETLLKSLLALSELKKIDGIFCVNDRIGWMTSQVLQKLRPKDFQQVRIIGFGNLGSNYPLASTISTFDQQTPMIGRKAAELLLQRINQKRKLPPQSLLIPATYIAKDIRAEPK